MTRWRDIVAAIAALVVLALGAIVACVAFGLTIDASRWRDTAASRLTAALGRAIVLEGSFELTLGREAVLRIGGVRVLNQPGFAATEFVTLGEAHARFGLIEALRGKLRVRSIEATDVRVWLERAADGRTSWASARGPGSSPAAIDVGQIMLHGLAVHYHDTRSATRRMFALDEVSAIATRDDRLRLALRGRVDRQPAYAVAIEGGPLRLLQEGSAPWPFTLDFEAPGTRLHASGAFDATSGRARFDFGAGTDDLAQVAQLLDTNLPRFGVAALYGTVVAAADAVEFADLRVALGKSELSGHLTLALGGARPRVSGALTVATLDLRPFLVPAQGPHDQSLDFEQLRRHSLPLRDLVPVDVDVDLRVGQWLGTPVDLRDARLELRADAHGMRVPIGATVAGVPISGQIELDTAAATPTLAVRIAAKDWALGDPARVPIGASAIQGTLGRVGLRLGGRGETLGSLVRDLELALAVTEARLSYGNVAGGRSIAFTLDMLDVAMRRGERLRGSARGTFLGERADLSLRGGTLADLLGEPAMPVELDLATALAQLRIEGTLARSGAKGDTDLAFDFRARRSGDLARWLGVAADSNLPLTLRGRARIATDAWHLEATTFKLGRSEVSIDGRRSRLGERPVTIAVVRSPLIDVPELATLRASTSSRGKPGARIDVPILPYAVDLGDADVDLAVAHLALGRTELVDVGFAAHVREGRLLPSPVAGAVAGAPFTGQVALDLRGEVPEVRLDLSTGGIDVGALLRELGVAEDIDGRADALHLTLVGSGNTLHELAGHSALEARVIGGSITVRGAAERPVAEIRVTEAIIGAPAGGPIQVRLNGTLDETTVEIEMASGTLADFAHDAMRLPFTLAANAAGARLTLAGEVELPLGRAGQLTLEMSGERLDTLNGLARVELPRWGPWSLRGPIVMTPSGYELRELLVRVGESRLHGNGALDVTGTRPRLDLRMTAPGIQLDDFPMPKQLADSPPKPIAAPGLRATTRNMAGHVERLLSAGFLRRLDARVDVEVQEVRSGTDRLADGALRVQVIDGQFTVGPAHVNLPGGTMRLSIAYDPTGSEVEVAARAYVKSFDYGIIARRLGPADNVQGLLDLNLEFAGRAPSLDAIMRHADGRIDFAVRPTDLDFRGGIFDFWSVNLLLALLPVIDPGGESNVNCIVGRFDLKQGNLTDDRIVIDTARVRIRGAGNANLATRELAFVIRPRAKGLALFRLQTPLRVSGTFTDYRIGVERSDMIESILHMIGSPILLPLERLFLGPLPRDGADVCTDPLRANDPGR